MVNLLADILLPPASLAVLALLLVRAGRGGRAAAAFAMAIVIALGLPAVSAALLNSLTPAPDAASGPAPAAIVILSADAIRTTGPTEVAPGPLTLDRTRAGAALARRTGLPILVSGGAVSHTNATLATMMAESLHDDFGVQSQWQEARSRDTWENAAFSAGLLQKAGIRRVYLVTHDWHMRRSLLAFRHFGLDPVPVSVRPAGSPPFTWQSLLISPVAWVNSFIALHEWVGLAYYAVRR